MPPEPVTSVLSPHSVILWLGDLNYRIEELDVETVKKLIEEKAFQTLYAYDQVQMAACAFEGSCPRTVRAQEGLGCLRGAGCLFLLGWVGFPEERMAAVPPLSCLPSSTAVPPPPLALPSRCLIPLGDKSVRVLCLSLSLSLSLLISSAHSFIHFIQVGAERV